MSPHFVNKHQLQSNSMVEHDPEHDPLITFNVSEVLLAIPLGLSI